MSRWKVPRDLARLRDRSLGRAEREAIVRRLAAAGCSRGEIARQSGLTGRYVSDVLYRRRPLRYVPVRWRPEGAAK